MADAPKLTRNDSRALWHAVQALKDIVSATRKMDPPVAEEALVQECERLRAARAALAKVQRIVRARTQEADPIAAFMAQQAEASRPLRPGEPCPDCDGTGTAGGQFTGGYWPCERCGATGAGTQGADR